MATYNLNDSQIVITTVKKYNQKEDLIVDSDTSKDLNDRTVLLPISPSDLMFNEDSDGQTIKLMNYGELPVGMNRKLATWGVSSFFPKRNNKARYHYKNGRQNSNKNEVWKYPFDISSGTEDPYSFYCATLLEWKNSQTPLVFMFNTWGEYYYCQIKSFNFGRKDAIGNVYYDLQFQEYKEYTKFNSGAGSTDYSSDVYYPGEGENILQIAKKLYGDSSYYIKIMQLNSMDNPEIIPGQAYKIR